MNPDVLPAQDRAGVFGAGTIQELPRLLEEQGVSSVLLVTGRTSFTASGASEVLPALRSVLEVETWSDFAPNPSVDDVVRGAQVVQRLRPGAIVAIGGGSALDVAKLLAVLGDGDAGQIHEAVRANRVLGRSRKLILVPTTSGSGSEATHFAVVYEGDEKYSVAHPSLLPDAVVVDPALTLSGSAYQKATSVMDAVAQAVESHWARGATAQSRSFAADALTALVPSAAAFVEGDEEAAVLAARGSHLAGRAIDLSKTTGPHAFSYGLTKRHGISHGHAVATTLGAFARLHAAAAGDQLGADLEQIASLVGADDVAGLGDRLDRLAAEVGLELRWGALGVPRSDVAVLARAVNLERLSNNPVDVGPSDIDDLLATCW